MENNVNTANKYSKYKNLTPDYHFSIEGSTAEGILPDGTEFKIDADKIDLVSKYFFHLNWKGYIYSLKSKEKKHNLMLHWLVLGYTSRPAFLVDHINRDKTDCRVENLRMVTNQQNSMNRKIGSTNKTGYLGVHINKQKNMYSGRICINNKRITLLNSPDPIECAQAYNYASELLFRQFTGHRNDVPEATDEIKAEVYRKCLPLFKQSESATMPVAFIQPA